MINSGIIFVLVFIAFFTAFVFYILKNRDRLRNTGSDQVSSPDAGYELPDEFTDYHADTSHDVDVSDHDV